MDKVSWWRTSVGQEEVDRLVAAITEEHISMGPVTAELEEKFVGALHVPYAVATTSGSMALLMSLMALNIGRDDEVLVPDRTFIATAHAPMLLGARPVLVDVRPDCPVLDLDQVRSKITSRTKAIIPVHRNGRDAGIVEINRIAQEYGLHVIEDACQALFSRNKDGYLGTQSEIGCFSLGMTKLISTGQGGMIVTGSEEMADRLKRLRNHGTLGAEHVVFNHPGFNFKFTDMQAAIGIEQLARAPARIAHLTTIYNKYAAALESMDALRLIPVDIVNGQMPLWVEALSDRREALMDFLTQNGIETIKFRPDLHVSPHLAQPGDFPNARIFQDQGMTLPCGPDQPLENIDRVIQTLDQFHRQQTATDVMSAG